MATFNASVERTFPTRVKHFKRPLPPQLLTLVFTILQPVAFVLLNTVKERPIKAATRKRRTTPSSVSSSSPRQIHNVFIDALAQACSCRLHTRPRPSLAQAIVSNPGHMYHKARRRNTVDIRRQMRHVHRASFPPCPPTTFRPLSRDDYLSILDYYRESYSTHTNAFVEIASNPLNSAVLKCENDGLSTPGIHADIKGPLPPAHDPSGGIASSALAHLLKVLERDDCTHEEAFEAYSNLPFPGVSNLSEDTCRLLFRRLSVLEKKSRTSKMRYLSVVDDMKSAGLSNTPAEWNSAIAFCGQCLTFITAADVEIALRMWTEMEQEANIRGGIVTFNILFDLAAKAQKFVLAEMILKEMGDRNLKYNRYSRNAFIFYHGLKQDGAGVRRAYREYVEAGEVVDTVVMNTVITALIRAGEPAAAEQVYERMKRMHTKQTGRDIPLGNWREIRDLGRLLNRAARHFKNDSGKLRQLQEEQSIAPDTRTYTHLVEYHASQSGEIRRIAVLLSEMRHLGLPMHGRIFVKIFKGFAYHGGVRYTSWTRSRLEAVWESMLEASDQRPDDVRVLKWMVVWAVKAFERCAGRQRTLQIWSELRRRWEPGDGDIDFVMSILRATLNSGHYR